MKQKNKYTGFSAYIEGEYLCDVPDPTKEEHEGFVFRLIEERNLHGKAIDVFTLVNGRSQWIMTHMTPADEIIED